MGLSVDRLQRGVPHVPSRCPQAHAALWFIRVRLRGSGTSPGREHDAKPAALGLVASLTISCSREGSQPAPAAAPAPAPKPLTAGVDPSGFDKTVRPQDDLYKFVNGAWLAKTEIPPDRGAYGGFYEAIDRTQERLRAIVEGASKTANKAPGSDQQKLGDFFAAFMDEARVNQLGKAPLDPELARIDALASKTDLARHMARMLMLNMTTLVGGGVDGDAQDPKTSVLYLSQSGLGLPDRDYYLKADPKLKEYRTKYQAYIAKMLTLAGQPSPDAAAKEIVAFETRLARAHWTNVESRDAVKTYNKVTLGGPAQALPRRRLGCAGPGSSASATPRPSSSRSRVTSRRWPPRSRELPVDRWKPYLKFHTVSGLAPYLSKEFVEARFDFYGRTLQGVKEMQPRWKRAVNNLDSTLGELLGKVYVEQHFKPDAKARMERLVENLRAAFREGIDKLEWMGPETKKEAQAKLAAFRPKIGYPNKWRDYSKVEIRPDDLVGNMMRAWMADSIYQLGKAGKPIDPEDWGMTPQTVNAYYNPVRNEIVFPAAILQPPFFDPDADDAANYGGIGGVIGHEMGHGFDDQGRRYDAKGQLRDWWTAEGCRGVHQASEGARRAVFGDGGAAGSESQRRADARREHRRPDGRHDLPSRVRAVARRQGAAGDRRHHRIPALLLRLGSRRGGRSSATTRCGSRC